MEGLGIGIDVALDIQTPAEVRYLDHKKLPQRPSEQVHGRTWKIRVEKTLDRFGYWFLIYIDFCYIVNDINSTVTIVGCIWYHVTSCVLYSILQFAFIGFKMASGCKDLGCKTAKPRTKKTSSMEIWVKIPQGGRRWTSGPFCFLRSFGDEILRTGPNLWLLELLGLVRYGCCWASATSIKLEVLQELWGDYATIIEMDCW